MIGGEGVEVMYEKRVEVIFGGEVGYVDLGRGEVIGGKGEGGEKMMGVKGRVRNFGKERNMWVMREEGSL